MTLLQKIESSDVPIWIKVEKPHSFVILRGLKEIRDEEIFSKIRLEHFCHLSMFYLTARFQKNDFRETASLPDKWPTERPDVNPYPQTAMGGGTHPRFCLSERSEPATYRGALPLPEYFRFIYTLESF